MLLKIVPTISIIIILMMMVMTIMMIIVLFRTYHIRGNVLNTVYVNSFNYLNNMMRWILILFLY